MGGKNAKNTALLIDPEARPDSISSKRRILIRASNSKEGQQDKALIKNIVHTSTCNVSSANNGSISSQVADSVRVNIVTNDDYAS